MREKEFVSPGDLVRDSFALARRIYGSGFLPQVLVVVWRGGTPVGIAIHEFLQYKGVRTYHTVIKAESYQGIDRRAEVRIENEDFLASAVPHDARVLVVDDIFDSGCTLRRIRELLAPVTRNVKTATLYARDDGGRSEAGPDFFLRKTDRWIVFPHELMDLTAEEIRRKDPLLCELLA